MGTYDPAAQTFTGDDSTVDDLNKTINNFQDS